jgi:hypothetical protein
LSIACLVTSVPALAQRHGGSVGHGFGGHAIVGHGFVGPRVGFGINFGFPLYAPAYYPAPYYPYYPAPYYGYPPAAAAPSPSYVEQGASSQPAPAPVQSDWFYCAGAKAYYPYVTECPGGWQRVAPQPPSG